VDARRPLTIETNQAVAACAATAKSKTFAACFTATAKTFVATSTACVIAAQAITGAAKTANCKLQLEKNDLLLHLPLRHLLLLPTALLPCRVDCHGKLPSTVRFKTTRGKTASMGSVICRSMENSLCERALEQLGKRKGIATPV
jgi:hypothetical protein